MNQAEQDLLVLTAQSGNQQAFGLLFKCYHKSLIGFALKMSRDRELAMDAVQEAWIKAAKNIRKLDDPRAFRSWIYRLVRWTLTDLLRRKTRQNQHLQSYDETTDIDLTATSDNSDETLTMAIKRLPNIENQMIHLFYLDEMTVKEISLVLELPAGTIKSRLNRARKLLKQKYQSLEK